MSRLLARIVLLSLVLFSCTHPSVPGETVTQPAITSISPPQALVGQTLTVLVAGSETGWTSGATVSFGPGIAIGTVSVRNATMLSVDLQVSMTATPGARDVTVTDDGVAVASPGGFHVFVPVNADVPLTVTQGSAFLLHVTDPDPTLPFGVPGQMSGFPPGFPLDGGTTAFEGFQILPPPWITAVLLNISNLEADMLVFIDVNAALGDCEIVLQYQSTDFAQEAAAIPFSIQARTPKMLTPGVPDVGTLTTGQSSDLYELQAPIPSVVGFSLGAGGATQYALLGAGGTFSHDQIDIGTGDGLSTGTQGTTYYVIVFNPEGNPDDYNLNATVTPLTVIPNATPGETPAAAQSLAQLPALVENARLPSALANNFYSLTAKDADLGKSIWVQITDSPQTDTSICIFAPDGETPLPGGSPLSDVQNLGGGPIATPGTYYVDILSGTFWSPAHESYDVTIWTE